MIKRNKKTERKKKKTTFDSRRDLQIKTDGQVYAKVLKNLGNCRLELECYDGIKRLGHIRGSMKNKVWISVGDIVLISTRDFQDDKCDVILKYTSEEVRKLINYGDLTNNAADDSQINEEENENAAGFTFEDI